MKYPSPSISSITRGPRQSNIELLRILAMFLVLVVHADFWSLGSPDASEFSVMPANAFTRTFFQSISIVCVNVFILISGWFGIKFSGKGLTNFIFQCAYFLFGIYIFVLIIGKASLSPRGLAECLCLTKDYWFIKAYVGLYILSPILNTYLASASERQQRVVLILFYLFQTIYGWSQATTFISEGYSTFSFVGLYLLASYLRNNHMAFISRFGGVMFILSVLVNTCIYYVATTYHIPLDTYAYLNPFVIIGAVGLFGLFLNLNIKTNSAINWVAKSAFAAFLLHLNPNIGPSIYKTVIKSIYNAYSGMECIVVIFGFLVAVFTAAVILDQPRKWLWSIISKKTFKH